MASPKFLEPPSALPATSTEEIDNALNRLNKSKEAWLDVSAEKRGPSSRVFKRLDDTL